MTINKRFLPALVLLVSVPWPASAVASEGKELLRTMQSAVSSLSYSGKLVFSKGSELSEYKIEHTPGQGNGSETVIELNKGGNAAAGQQQFSLINSSGLRLPDQQAYSIDIGGDAQVAGLSCKVVVVRPKDKMRYLHRYCISPNTGMLLRYSVMNRQQQLLEQFMFTQLSIAAPQRQNTQMIQQQPESAGGADIISGTWDFSALPRGFKINQIKAVPGKTDAHQIILFDGLTFVSVFIEPGDMTATMKKQFPASGATNILTHKVANHTVTLIGEVPRETLQTIQNGLRHVGP